VHTPRICRQVDGDVKRRVFDDSQIKSGLARQRSRREREAGLNANRQVRDEVAAGGLSERQREDRAETRAGLGIGEIGAMVGGLIQQGRSLPVVLASLCELFEATVKGYSSTVLLLDRSGARVRSAAGHHLPAGNLRHLEGRDGQQAAAAAAPGLRLHEAVPIASLTGEPLGTFVVYRRESYRDVPRCEATLIAHFSHVAGAAIERIRSDEALKRSAALLERTQQLSSICCFSWSVETDEISWSKELCQLFELHPTDMPVTLELIGTRIHSEDLPAFHEMVERARTGLSDFEFEHRLRLRDNSVKYLRVVAHPIRNHEGQLEYIGAVQDVTHRRHAEEALAKLRAELARAARVTSLGVLTAAIAHEVNQPLAGIVANASTCRRMLAVDPPDIDGARETARRTIRDAERASEIVKRLRALFCKKGTSIESLDLNEAIREVIALSLRELERNQVIVRTELGGELPAVQGDRVQLQQVILNLLLNASDAMSSVDDRARQLVIRTEQDEENRVRVSVQDAGVGFDIKGADRLFDAFYTTKSGGMGIGLSVSRFIIESHKGHLWATPNSGPGATFCFSIPCIPQGMTAAATGARSLGAIRMSPAANAELLQARSPQL
jgi:PAS domain S-box-containing protein